MAQNYELSIETGKVSVPIREKADGELIGQFAFNPNDLDILKRYEIVVNALEKIKVPKDADADAILAVSDELKKQMDYLLNFPVSDDIFAKCNPLTLTENGNFYIENVIDGIAGLIEQVMNTRIEKKRKKIEKATAKYHN